MGDKLQVHLGKVRQVNGSVQDCESSVTDFSKSTELISLNAGVSRMSGLDQLGGAHGQVIHGAIGSATHTYTELTKQLEWISEMLQKTGRSVEFQNFAVRRMLMQDGEPVPRGELNINFPDRPAQDTSDFPFDRPVVVRQASLAGVVADLESTDSQVIVDASDSWRNAASQAEEWAGLLEQAASDLAANNTGDWVDQATARMGELAEQSRTYAGNARTMASSVSTFGLIPGTYLPQVSHALRVAETITDPAQRAAAEQAYLQLFYAGYEADVQSAVPPIRNLVTPAAYQGGQGNDVTAGMGGGNPAGTGLAAATELAQNSIGPGAAALGGVPTTGQMATHPAHTPALPSITGTTPTPVTTTGTGTGGGVAPNALATLARHGIQPPRTLAEGGGWPHLANNHQPGTRPGPGGATNSPWGAGSPSATGGRHRALGPIGSVLRPGPVLGDPTGRHSATTSGTLGGTAIGRPGGAGSSGGVLGAPGSPGGVGTGVPGGLGAGTPSDGGARGGTGGGGVSAHPQGTNGGGRGGAGMPMAGAPMAPGASSRDSKGKVKRVTSKVEYSKNLRDLLGEPRPFIPGVIGTWVREQ